MAKKFKNKAERNAGFKTQAQEIFGGKKMLLERPPEMDPDEYRLLRKIQTELLKSIFHKGHSPSRKLQGITGNKEPLARTSKGLKRIVRQRRAG